MWEPPSPSPPIIFSPGARPDLWLRDNFCLKFCSNWTKYFLGLSIANSLVLAFYGMVFIEKICRGLQIPESVKTASLIFRFFSSSFSTPNNRNTAAGDLKECVGGWMLICKMSNSAFPPPGYKAGGVKWNGPETHRDARRWGEKRTQHSSEILGGGVLDVCLKMLVLHFL